MKNTEEKITCETGLKAGIINREVYEREIKLCQQLSKENGGKCGWGKCEDCGVPLLLEKLYKGIIVSDSEEIKKLKENIIK